MRHLAIYPLIPLVASLGLIRPAHIDDPEQVPDPQNVVERFKVAKEGDCLLLPVKLKGKSYLFLLDTGASLNVFDSSIPLGKPNGVHRVQTPSGPVRLPHYAAPEASVGGLSLRTDDPVFAVDYSKFRQVSGQEIYGMVGMPFLRQHVVQVDFDKGELLILKAAGSDCGHDCLNVWLL